MALPEPKPFLETAIDIAGFSTDTEAYRNIFSELVPIVVDLQKFDVGAEWVNEAKLRTADDKLQMALLLAMALGSLISPSKMLTMVQAGALARQARKPKLDQVSLIVAAERASFWARHLSERPGSRPGAEVAERIVHAVNGSLAAAGLASLSANAIAKRINKLDAAEGLKPKHDDLN